MNRSNSSEQHKECAAVDVSDSKLNRQAALVREPFLLKPTGKDYLWGGNRLNDDFSKGIDMQPLAETWECSTHPDGPSTIASGTFEGEKLPELIAAHPEILGTHPQKAGLPKGQIPILVKFIDAAKDLSIQVHPDDAYARAHENGALGKTEMWYVVDATKDASLIYGFNRAMDREKVRRALTEVEGGRSHPATGSDAEGAHAARLDEQGSWDIAAHGTLADVADLPNDTEHSGWQRASQRGDSGKCTGQTRGKIEKYLNRVPVNQGDVFYIEAGTVHAICAGSLIVEIQENSNLTYRMYDYHRTDKNGRERELNIDKALDVANFHAGNVPRQPMRVLRFRPGFASEFLCRCKYFEVERILLNTERIRKMAALSTDASSFQVLVCTDGCGTMFWGERHLEFFKGDTIFLPAESVPVRLHGRAEFLKVYC